MNYPVVKVCDASSHMQPYDNEIQTTFLPWMQLYTKLTTYIFQAMKA